MGRDSVKHGPRLDDELKRETASLEQGAPVEARSDEWREKEGPGEEDRAVEAMTEPLALLGSDEAEARTELSRWLLPSSFPGERDALVAGAEQESAPGPVLAALRSLPAGLELHTMHEVWVALRHPDIAARGRDAIRELAATDPATDADGAPRSPQAVAARRDNTSG